MMGLPDGGVCSRLCIDWLRAGSGHPSPLVAPRPSGTGYWNLLHPWSQPLDPRGSCGPQTPSLSWPPSQVPMTPAFLPALVH